MKKNEGITMLVLVITVILLLILSGISINTGNNIIKRANLENLKTNMLLIEVKGKEYVENGNFNLGTSFDKLTDENEKNKRNCGLRQHGSACWPQFFLPPADRGAREKRRGWSMRSSPRRSFRRSWHPLFQKRRRASSS